MEPAPLHRQMDWLLPQMRMTAAAAGLRNQWRQGQRLIQRAMLLVLWWPLRMAMDSEPLHQRVMGLELQQLLQMEMPGLLCRTAPDQGRQALYYRTVTDQELLCQMVQELILQMGLLELKHQTELLGPTSQMVQDQVSQVQSPVDCLLHLLQRVMYQVQWMALCRNRCCFRHRQKG